MKLFVPILAITGASLLIFTSAFAGEQKTPAAPAKSSQESAPVKDDTLSARVEELRKSVQKLSVKVENEITTGSETAKKNLRRELDASDAKLHELADSARSSVEAHGKTANDNISEALRDIGKKITKLSSKLNGDTNTEPQK